MMTAYVIEMDDKNLQAKIICPFLKDAPWCEEYYFLAPYTSIEKEISAHFNEAKWREDNPISLELLNLTRL